MTQTTLPPRVLDHLDSFSEILSAGRVGLFSDFDGTLTPLCDDPRDTSLSPVMRSVLAELSKKLDLVAVVSGRDVNYLREMIGLESVTYVGNHGLEVWKAGVEEPEYAVRAPDGLPEDVQRGIKCIGIPGLYVENKYLSVAVHYRNAPEPATAQVAVSQLLNHLAASRGLNIREGKMVLEIGPGAGMNKGAAVDRLAREFRLTAAIALGDDLTDCDAFDAMRRLIRERGLVGASAAVVDEETPEAVLRKADYRLAGPGDVEKFLRWMAHASPRAETKL